MTAYPSAIPESTAAEQRAHEPSMEEILASIRKIISEDQSSPLGPLPDFHTPRDETHVQRDEIHSSRDEDHAPRDERQAPRVREPEVERMRPPVIARPPVDFSMAFNSPPPSRPARPEPPRSSAEPLKSSPEPTRSSPAPFASRHSADVREFGARPPAPAPRLVTATDEQPLLSDQTDMAVNSSFQVLNAARSMPSSQAMESVARDLLRPMLKEWLDDNLPSLVERLVRAEIERVSRGR